MTIEVHLTPPGPVIRFPRGTNWYHEGPTLYVIEELEQTVPNQKTPPRLLGCLPAESVLAVRITTE